MWLFVDFLFALELLGGGRQCKKCVIADKYVQVEANETNGASAESSSRNMKLVGISFSVGWIIQYIQYTSVCYRGVMTSYLCKG